MATDSPLITSYQEFLLFLDRESVLHQPDPTAKAVSIPTEQKQIEGVQFIRWQDEDGILQFIQSMAVEVPVEQVAAVESAIARLNHALAWPGLDLNHDSRGVAYRVVLPLLPRGGVEPREIQSCFRLAVRTATDLVPTLRRVASGTTAPADVLADAQRQFASDASAPSPTAPSPTAPSSADSQAPQAPASAAPSRPNGAAAPAASSTVFPLD
jgi:hypothetical protein